MWLATHLSYSFIFLQSLVYACLKLSSWVLMQMGRPVNCDLAVTPQVARSAHRVHRELHSAVCCHVCCDQKAEPDRRPCGSVGVLRSSGTNWLLHCDPHVAICCCVYVWAAALTGKVGQYSMLPLTTLNILTMISIKLMLYLISFQLN